VGSKYTVEMGSGAVIYIPGFIKTGSAVHKLMGDAWTARRSVKPTLSLSLSLLFKIRN
jgi:hypothetical protein